MQGSAGLGAGGQDVFGVAGGQGHCGGIQLALGGKCGDGVAFFGGVAALKADGTGDQGEPLAEAGGGIER